MWIKSKRDYIREYFLGDKENKDFLKPYGDFGTKVGEALENNDFSGFNEEESDFLKTLPRYDEFERKITLNLDGFYMTGYIDSSTMPKDYVEHILDYKTGQIEKRKPEYEDDKYIQLEIYAAALEQEFGTLPKTAKVVLIDRLGNAFKGEKLVLGDNFITITKNISRERIDQVKKQLQETAEEISEYYQTYLKFK